jgi:AcrR family transcriptional regulator
MPRPANPELVDRIIRVTAEALAEKGIDGVTMRGVAQRVGCSPTVIYHYFDSKDGLMHAAVVRGLQMFGAAVGAADSGTGAERLRSTSRAYVRWGIDNPALYELAFQQRLPRPAEGEELQRRRSGLDGQQRLLEAILPRDETGRRVVDASLAAQDVFVTLHGVVSTTLSGRLFGPAIEHDEAQRLAESLVDFAVDQWRAAWGLADLAH